MIYEYPVALFRYQLEELAVLNSIEVESTRHGDMVWVAGMSIIMQAPPTAGGARFLRIEDEFGVIDIIIRKQDFRRFQALLESAPLLLIEGEVQRKGTVVEIVMNDARAIPH